MADKVTLTENEKEAIRYFARSGKNRAQAVAVYEKHIAEHVKGNRNLCPEVEFMSEVLSPCPDIAYRGMLRRKILATS